MREYKRCFTKKHYETLANHLKHYDADPVTRAKISLFLVDVLEADSSRFDKMRFIRASDLVACQTLFSLSELKKLKGQRGPEGGN